jgi:chromosome segregation ATPase
VNKEDVSKQALTQAKAQADAARAEAQAARDQLTAANTNLTSVQQQANDQATRAQAQLVATQGEASRLSVDLAKATSQAATQQLDISRLTEALNASQTTTGRLNEEVARLRTTNDTLVRQTSDLNATVSDLTNRLDVTERERRLLAEQVQHAQGEMQRLSAIVSGAGLSPKQQELAVNRSGMPNINGVVRDVRTIAGNQYATISVGSADQVARGMEFKVLDRQNGNFLGTLIVDSVEPNEATGRLFGPRVAEIKPGVTVQTQM